MQNIDVIRAAFADELEKIAGELQGLVRSGRRPISAERLLERESEQAALPSQVVEGQEKVSALRPEQLRGLALVGMGAGGYHLIRKANQDRRMGRMMRLQSSGAMYGGY